jgi:pSer/pThr/pTyr-binding forkhead associated (FHA) protein
VVNVPKVSGHHCRLTWDDSGYVLEDLGSTNGTFVNGVRVTDRVRVKRSDSITLGLTTPMTWPHEATDPGNFTAQAMPRIDPTAGPTLDFQGTEMVVGRAPDCNRSLDLPMVSGRHARLFRANDQILIEDLGSANGTFVNGRRVDGDVAVKVGDLISLGSYTLVLRVASRDVVFEGNSAMVDARPPTPTPSGPEGQPVRAGIDRRREFAKALNRNWRLVTLLGHAPLVAILIIMAMRAINPAPATPGNWPAIPRAVAAGLFWLGLSAIWFGLSNAVLGNLIDATRLREGLRPRGVASLLYRLGVVGTLCACQCALAWAIVSKVVGLNGPWLTSLALLILASAVGLALGLLIVAIPLNPSSPWAVLSLAVLVLWLFAGGQPSWSRTVSNATPSRWVHEGLLLLESDPQPPAAPDERSNPPRNRDLAEVYFPSGSNRMGTRADAMALALMAFGLIAATGFIAHERGRRL